MRDLGRNTFELEELNEQFWENAFVIYEMPGRLSIFTTDKMEYVISLDGAPFEDFDELLDNVDLDDWNSVFGAMVHKEYAAAFSAAYEQRKETQTSGQPDVSPYTAVAMAASRTLGEEILLPQTVCRGSVLAWYDRKSSTYFHDQLEAKKLSAEDFDWKPLYPNNIESNGEEGQYALIFREVDGKVRGTKFSVVYNYKWDEGLCRTDKIESYDLYVKDYDDVLGPLHYPPLGDDSIDNWFADSSNDCTFGSLDVNDYGPACCPYDSLEEAKAGVLQLVEWRGYDRDNLITDLDNTEREYRNWRRHYGAIEEFQNRYAEILKVVYEFEYPEKGCYGGGFIITALEEQLGIRREYAEEMLKYIPMILTRRKQRKVSEMMAKCREVLGD